MISEKELLILSHLRKNARQPITSISRKTKIPVSTIHDRVKSFEKKIIKKHTTLIDFSKIGFNIRLHMLINVEKREDFMRFISKDMYINSAYAIDGYYNFVLDCLFRDMTEMDRFMEKIEQFVVKEKKFSYILHELKRESFLENPKILEVLKW